MLNLEEMTLIQLKKLAKEHNIKNISKLKKDELVAMLTQILKETEENEVKEEEEKVQEEDTTPVVEKEPVERRYDENGEPIIDYKLTNEGDEIVEGILDILPDGYGFLRGDNFLSSEKDVYISMVQIRRFKLDTGDIVKGISRFKEKFLENPLFLYRKELEKLVNEGLIIVDLDNIKLTNKGLDLANIVFEEFV